MSLAGWCCHADVDEPFEINHIVTLKTKMAAEQVISTISAFHFLSMTRNTDTR